MEITWEISARDETECEGGNRCFLYLLLYTRVLRMRLWIFSPGWNFLSITWGISARSTGLKISFRAAQTGLNIPPGSPGWNFLHVIGNSDLQGFHRKPGTIPGWKSPCYQSLKMPAAYGQDLRCRVIWYSQIAQQRCEGARAEFWSYTYLLSPEISFSLTMWICKLTINLHVVLCWQLIKQKPRVKTHTILLSRFFCSART